jgi:hypothetical protein
MVIPKQLEKLVFWLRRRSRHIPNFSNCLGIYCTRLGFANLDWLRLCQIDPPPHPSQREWFRRSDRKASILLRLAIVQNSQNLSGCSISETDPKNLIRMGYAATWNVTIFLQKWVITCYRSMYWMIKNRVKIQKNLAKIPWFCMFFSSL